MIIASRPRTDDACTNALRINESGWILGTEGSSTYALFINHAAGPVNALLADSSLTVQSVLALNNNGQMLAIVQDRGGNQRAVILAIAKH